MSLHSCPVELGEHLSNKEIQDLAMSYFRTGGGGVDLPAAGGEPTRMGVLHSRHGTTLLRSWFSTSMYFRHFALGH